MSEFHQHIPAEPGKRTAIVLAGLMHVLLFLFFWIGIHWQSKAPVGIEAEIWDVTPRSAAPKPVVVTPPPIPKAEPQPVIKEVEQEEEDADIALQKAREKKLNEQKRAEEKEKKRLQEQAKHEAQLKEKQKEEQKKKQDVAKLEAQKKADALIQKQREDNLKRLTSQMGGTGDAVKSSGNNRLDPGYAGKIAAKIKSNMVYVGPDSSSDNPTVEYVINLFPDGSLKGTPRKTKPSGVIAFDDAVERAIIKSAPYPADKSGRVPETIPLTYRLKD